MRPVVPAASVLADSDGTRAIRSGGRSVQVGISSGGRSVQAGERLGEIGDEVVGRFDAHRQAHQRVGHLQR